MENNSKTSNILYNIINYEEPNIIFNYAILLVFFIFIFNKISVTFSLYVGLIFFTIIIYYSYTQRELNSINNIKKKKEKFNILFTKEKILEKFPEFVDILFYMEDYKQYNIPVYLDIVMLFERFAGFYNDCIKNFKNINTIYQDLLDIKVTILSYLNFYIFNTGSNILDKKIVEIKNKTEQILNSYLEKIVIIQKKDLYYNGYNIDTNICSTSNILPYNFLTNFTVNNNNKNFNNKNFNNYNMDYLLVYD